MNSRHSSKSVTRRKTGAGPSPLPGIPHLPDRVSTNGETFPQFARLEAKMSAELSSSGVNCPKEDLLDLYSRMVLIRAAEEQLAHDCANGKLPGPVHLYIGQEAVAAGVCAQLTDSDWISSTHRGHGHFLAK